MKGKFRTTTPLTPTAEFILIRLLAFFICTLTLLPLKLSAQPGVEMYRLFNGGYSEFEYFHDIYLKADGGYFLAGASYRRSWALSINDAGRVEWQSFIGPPQDEGGGDPYLTTIEADNGDMVVGGVIDAHFSARRLNGNSGEMIWEHSYVRGRCQTIIELKSGEFMLAGYTYDSDSGYVSMIDEDGRQIWDLFVEPFDQEQSNLRLNSMRETDGGVVITGWSGLEGILIKVNFEGELVWRRSYGRVEDHLHYESVVSDGRGGFVLTGNFALNNGQGEVFYITFVNAEGQEIRSRRLPQWGTFNDPFSIARMPNGGYSIAGYTSRINRENITKLTIARVDSQGELVWFTHLDEFVGQEGVGTNHSLRSIVALENNKIVACGEAYNEDEQAGIDGVIVRFSEDWLGPELFYKSPVDSVLKVLRGESIRFVVRARNQEGNEMQYRWLYGDSLISDRNDDTSKTVRFNNSGDIPISCQVSYAQVTIVVRWTVIVRDLYVSAFTPDTLNLAIRRGTSADFSLDTIRYTDGEEPEILWTKTNLANGQADGAGSEPRAIVTFPWSGEYEVEGRAYHGESSDAVTWHVQVRGAIWAYVPLTDSLEVVPDSVVHFEVVPTLPEDESLQVAWSVDGELVREGELALDWAFSAPVHNVHSVHCVLSDSVETDSVQWVVTVSDLSTPHDPAADPPRSAAILSVNPNPFNSTLTIRFQSVKSVQSVVNITIYDIFGREVFSVASPHTSGKITPPTIVGGASQTLTWDASAQPAGVYFVRLQSGSSISTKKVVLMR